MAETPDKLTEKYGHPDCRACEERKRINLGLMLENQQLKKKLKGLEDGKATTP